MKSPADITHLLRAWKGGDSAALNDLMPIVYEQLRTIAGHHFRSERSTVLQATAVVHEAFLRLAGSEVDWNDRAHFFAVASHIMRRILIDQARKRKRVRRGGGNIDLPIDEAVAISKEPDQQILDLDAALSTLAKFDERKASIVEMVYFGGMTYPEIAAALAISEATVHRELKFARAWVRQELEGRAAPA